MIDGESRNIEHNVVEQKRVGLVSRLQEIQKSFDIWGHGVESAETAEKIMAEGLHTEWKALHDIAHEIPKDTDSIVKKFNGWDYQARKYIVLIAVPKGFASTDYGGYPARIKSIKESENHVFTKSEESKRTILPGKIIGFVDANDFSFLENRSFFTQ